MPKQSKFLEDYRQMQSSDFSHFLSENTRWGDSDMLGHINNVLYARYYESARTSYLFDVLAMDFIKPNKTGIILADMKIAYLQQLHHPVAMNIGARVSRLGGSSFHIDAALFIDASEMPISTSRATLVWFDYDKNQTIKIPQEVRQTIIDFEVIKPA